MKTKRIVALALASALALGAVATPVLADKPAMEDTTITKEATLAAFAKVYAAQSATVKAAEKKLEELNKEVNKQKKEMAKTHTAMKEAEGLLIKAQKAIDANEEEIEKYTKFVEEYENKIAQADADFAVAHDGIRPLEKLQQYEDEIKRLQKAGADAEEVTKLEKLRDDWKAIFPALFAARDKHALKVNELKDQRPTLKTDFDKQNQETEKATAAYMAAEKAWTQAMVDQQKAKDVLVHEKDVLRRIGLFKKDLTVESVQNETNPKLAKLAQEDLVAYILGRLAIERAFISESTLEELGLSDRVLKQYHDILGDEETIEPQESESDKSEEPTPEPKPEPKPEPQPDVKPDTKPDVKPEDKKDDKKVAPKTGDIAVLAYAGSAVLAAGAFVASKKRK